MSRSRCACHGPIVPAFRILKPQAPDSFRWTDRSPRSDDLQQTTIDTSVYRKNLQRVVYVTEMFAGGEESPVYAIVKMSDTIDKIKLPDATG